MKRIGIVIVSMVFAAAGIVAHEGNEHVRGVVTELSPKSITIQTTDKQTRALTINEKTTFQRAGKVAHLADLKVGDRVVVDVPEKSNVALLIQIGTANAAPAAAGANAKLNIALTTVPRPAKTGENIFEVTVTDAARKPVMDADVSVLLTMPAMPAMKMPAMRTEVALKPAGGGKYTGTGQLMMAGNWNVTVSVRKAGKVLGETKLALTAR